MSKVNCKSLFFKLKTRLIKLNSKKALNINYQNKVESEEIIQEIIEEYVECDNVDLQKEISECLSLIEEIEEIYKELDSNSDKYEKGAKELDLEEVILYKHHLKSLITKLDIGIDSNDRINKLNRIQTSLFYYYLRDSGLTRGIKNQPYANIISELTGYSSKTLMYEDGLNDIVDSKKDETKLKRNEGIFNNDNFDKLIDILAEIQEKITTDKNLISK